MTSFQRFCSAAIISVGLTVVHVATASATPIDSAVVKTRIWNDDPSSTLTTDNRYPTLVEISDTRTGGGGFANLHNFHLADAGVERAFGNGEAFSFSADVTISGGGDGEAGLQLSPWWSQDVDGRFNFRTTDGEIAVFGGRLPFYNFTGSQAITYTKGDTVRVGIDYVPNSLSPGDPATIVYSLTMGGTDYTSGPLAFDEGNPAEPYGTWGHLDDARVGGYMAVFSSASNLTTQWGNMSFIPEPTTLVLAGLGALVLMTRRRKR